MKLKLRRLGTVLIATGAALCLLAAPALAESRTWVSGVGDDANPCSRTAPCKTLAGAISKTTAGGEIDMLDSGGFGGVTITKSVTISATGVTGGVLVSGANAIIIDAKDADVVLNGLDVNGLGSSLAGVRISAARSVRLLSGTVKLRVTGSAQIVAGAKAGPRATLSRSGRLYATGTARLTKAGAQLRLRDVRWLPEGHCTLTLSASGKRLARLSVAVR